MLFTNQILFLSYILKNVILIIFKTSIPPFIKWIKTTLKPHYSISHHIIWIKQDLVYNRSTICLRRRSIHRYSSPDCFFMYVKYQKQFKKLDVRWHSWRYIYWIQKSDKSIQSLRRCWERPLSHNLKKNLKCFSYLNYSTASLSLCIEWLIYMIFYTNRTKHFVIYSICLYKCWNKGFSNNGILPMSFHWVTFPCWLYKNWGYVVCFSHSQGVDALASLTTSHPLSKGHPA